MSSFPSLLPCFRQQQTDIAVSKKSAQDIGKGDRQERTWAKGRKIFGWVLKMMRHLFHFFIFFLELLRQLGCRIGIMQLVKRKAFLLRRPIPVSKEG